MRIIFCGLVLFLFSIGQIGCSDDAASNSNEPGPSQTTDVNAISASQFTDANAALSEGSRLLDLGETEKAIEILNQAATLNPDLAEAYFRLGIAHSLIEIRDKSKEVTGEAVVATPTPEPTGKKGKEKENEVKTESEKAFEKAVEAYKKIIDANDEDHLAYYNLGRSYNKLNEDKDAAKALRQAVKLNPEDTEYQTELGAILVKLAQYEEAIQPLKKALELDPANSRATELLDEAESGRRRIDFAAKQLEERNRAKSGTSTDANTQIPDADAAKTPPSNIEVKPTPPAAKPQK